MLRRVVRRSFAATSHSSILRHNSTLSPLKWRDPIHFPPPLLTPTTTLRNRHYIIASGAHSGVSLFHTTRRNEALPMLPLIALLKTSAAFELARTAGRIVLTFVPVILLKNLRLKHYIRRGDHEGNMPSEEKREYILKKLKSGTLAFQILLSIPTVLVFATILASMERTPITGRWRMIVLSPEEEDEISAQLAGPGWYKAVGEILLQDNQNVRFINPADWRYAWVRDTLRRLEGTIPTLAQERNLASNWYQTQHDDYPLPPPADYPLTPRPRGTEYLRSWCNKMVDQKTPSPIPHAIPGPPYSLLIVDKPEASNAFSYGFGPDGGGGVVVYSGFLNEILAKSPPAPEQKSSGFFGLFSTSKPTRPPMPTEEQTTQLAILLAHELSHLILSHHIETLSSSTVFIPGTLSILSDIARVLIFPFTMIFGPFVNDAVAQLGKVGSGELVKMGEYCTSVNQEIEADVVSARLLAHAGFDARSAVSFWENRAQPGDCGHTDHGPEDRSTGFLGIMGHSHPVNDVRISRLKAELVRWEMERRAALAKHTSNPDPEQTTPQAINLAVL